MAPSASTERGNRSALPTVTAFGLSPCCRAWVQKLVKSGGISTPVTTSTLAFLNALICGEKSSSSGLKKPGSTISKPSFFSAGAKPRSESPHARPSPSLGHSAPIFLLVGAVCHMSVNTSMMSSSPQKKW